MNPLMTPAENAHIDALRAMPIDWNAADGISDKQPKQPSVWMDRSTTFVANLLRLLWIVMPLLVSGWLLYAMMDGVSGNWTAQWMIALILAAPLSGWIIKHLRRYV